MWQAKWQLCCYFIYTVSKDQFPLMISLAFYQSKRTYLYTSLEQDYIFLISTMLITIIFTQSNKRHSAGILGRTGNIRFPNDESCVVKYANELVWACWNEKRQTTGVSTQFPPLFQWISVNLHPMGSSSIRPQWQVVAEGAVNFGLGRYICHGAPKWRV